MAFSKIYYTGKIMTFNQQNIQLGCLCGTLLSLLPTAILPSKPSKQNLDYVWVLWTRSKE